MERRNHQLSDLYAPLGTKVSIHAYTINTKMFLDLFLRLI